MAVKPVIWKIGSLNARLISRPRSLAALSEIQPLNTNENRSEAAKTDFDLVWYVIMFDEPGSVTATVAPIATAARCRHALERIVGSLHREILSEPFQIKSRARGNMKITDEVLPSPTCARCLQKYSQQASALMVTSSSEKTSHCQTSLSNFSLSADIPTKTAIVSKITKMACKKRLSMMNTMPSMTLPMRFKILMTCEVVERFIGVNTIE